MSIKNIVISGSISSYPSQSYGQRIYISSKEEESFPPEKITGSSAGSVPNLLGQTASINLFVNISQSWSGSINTPQGRVQFIHNTQDEFINGEYSGSDFAASDQQVIDDSCKKFLIPDTSIVNYNYFFYYSSGSNAVTLGNFLNTNTAPSGGQILLYYNYSPVVYIPGNPPSGNPPPQNP